MADRIFAGALLIVTLAYGVIAFTVIRAPFQYDPLGPEGWPRLLAVASVLCLLGLLRKPDTERLDLTRTTLFRLGAAVLLLLAYAWLYEPLGFVLSTAAFGTVLALMLGAETWRALAFGVISGVAGFGVGVHLLGLNLPEGDWIMAVLDAGGA